MKLSRDIRSLSIFKRDTAKYIRQMKKTGEPIVLTINGKAVLVVQDADGFQRDFKILEQLALDCGSDVEIPRYFEIGFGPNG